MNMLFDRWYAASPHVRLLCWAGWLLMLLALLFFSATRQEENVAISRLRVSNHQQWANLHRLVDITPVDDEKTLPFPHSIFSCPVRNWCIGIHPLREANWR